MKRNKWKNAFSGGALWLFALLVIVPFLLVAWNSLKSKGEANLMNFAWPSEFHFENITYVWKKSNMLRAFFNSLLIAVVPVFFSTVFSAMATFALSRNRTRVNRVIYKAFILGLVLPINMLPTIRVLKTVGLMGSYAGIILLYSALLIPLAVFLYYSFISGIPRSLDEAALIDGAGGLRMFFSIVFPLLKPVTVTVVIMNFMNAWNDFLIPLYILNNSNKWGMILQVYNYYGLYQSNWNHVCAVVVLALLPVVIVYIIGQKYIISGMTAGSVKG